MTERTMHTSGQFAVRTVIFIVAGLSVLSTILGLDMLLGAFAAGVVAQVLLKGAEPADQEMVDAKLEAVGFGFLVPVFFIMTGVTFDLSTLIAQPGLFGLLAIALVLLLVIRGVPSMLAAPQGSTLADRGALALFGATGLPIIVAVTQIGVSGGQLSSGVAAALVGAGMLSVLIFPAAALALHNRAQSGAAALAP